MRKLKRKITFPGLEDRIEFLEELVFNELFYPKKNKLFSINYINSELEFVLDGLTKDHDNLYRNEVLDLIHKLRLFGLHFASLDIRQDSRIHHNVFIDIISHSKINDYLEGLPKDYLKLNDKERCKVLLDLKGDLPPKIFKNEMTYHTLKSIRAIKKIQKNTL